MKKLIFILVAFILLVGGIGYLYGPRLYNYFITPQQVKLTLVGTIFSDKELPSAWWTTVLDTDVTVAKQYNNVFPDIDMSKNYIMLSGGRELQNVSYSRYSKWLWWQDAYKANVVYKKDFYPHSIFVYKIDKIILLHDDTDN